MGKKSKQQWPFYEQVMWYCLLIGAFFCVVCAIPVVPWRYSRVDTNVGNRFVMERYYYVTGPTNNLGKAEGWLSLRKKMQRKTEEFGRPSPLTALLGTVSSAVSVGGAATGCMMWQACKNHVADRFIMYGSVGYCGIMCIIFILLGAGLGVCSAVFQGFEIDAEQKGKKKKKKKDEDCMEPATKTMTLSILSFMFTAGSITMYVTFLGNMLKDFQRTAYYPFAGSHAGPFIGGFGAALIFIGMVIAINRNYKCMSKKDDDDDDQQYVQQWDPNGNPYAQDPYAQGGYGGQPMAQQWGPPGGAQGGYGQQW